ncbi:MAG: helix-turn-helix domain-containing protein [Desulfobacteraceae bacterium]|nr:MAG: helix-turn-helix domain-containing protein [Desulfobacteraceae bacterium]
MIQLEMEELAASLSLTPATVERWIRQGRLPVRQKGNRCLFSFSSLKKWADTNHLMFVLPGSGGPEETEIQEDILYKAIERGGIYYDMEGDSIEAVLRSAVIRINGSQSRDQNQLFLESLLDREQLMSTGIGRGVAIPHPRTPFEDGDAPPQIAVCFLKTPIDYKAVDRKPVFVLFVLVSPSAKSHLQLLARLSYCLRDDTFVQFLNQRPGPDAFYERIREFYHQLDGAGSAS